MYVGVKKLDKIVKHPCFFILTSALPSFSYPDVSGQNRPYYCPSHSDNTVLEPEDSLANSLPDVAGTTWT